MATIPANFPDGCTPEEIRSAIRDMQAVLASNGYQINSVLQFSPLINLGQFELERRQNEAVVRQSKVVGFISLGIAVLALGISVEGSMSSSKWENQQLALLETISKNGDIGPILTQQTGILQQVGTQLSTGITCILKGEPITVGAQKPKPPTK